MENLQHLYQLVDTIPITAEPPSYLPNTYEEVDTLLRYWESPEAEADFARQGQTAYEKYLNSLKKLEESMSLIPLPPSTLVTQNPMEPQHNSDQSWSRRKFLTAAVASLAAVTAGGALYYLSRGSSDATKSKVVRASKVFSDASTISGPPRPENPHLSPITKAIEEQIVALPGGNNDYGELEEAPEAVQRFFLDSAIQLGRFFDVPPAYMLSLNKIEKSNHNSPGYFQLRPTPRDRSRGVSTVGATGPFQFYPPTWSGGGLSSFDTNLKSIESRGGYGFDTDKMEAYDVWRKAGRPKEGALWDALGEDSNADVITWLDSFAAACRYALNWRITNEERRNTTAQEFITRIIGWGCNYNGGNAGCRDVTQSVGNLLTIFGYSDRLIKYAAELEAKFPQLIL